MKFHLYPNTPDESPSYEEQLLLNFDEFLKKGCSNIRRTISTHTSGYRLVKDDLKDYFQPERFKSWHEEQSYENPGVQQKQNEEKPNY